MQAECILVIVAPGHGGGDPRRLLGDGVRQVRGVFGELRWLVELVQIVTKGPSEV